MCEKSTVVVTINSNEEFGVSSPFVDFLNFGDRVVEPMFNVHPVFIKHVFGDTIIASGGFCRPRCFCSGAGGGAAALDERGCRGWCRVVA